MPRWTVNRKKLQRLWRQEGLRVPRRRRCKRIGDSTVTAVTASPPNRVCAVDFQFDATDDGRPVKIVSIVDEHTRECLGGLVERSITADRLIDATASSPAADTRPRCAATTARNWHARRWGTGPVNADRQCSTAESTEISKVEKNGYWCDGFLRLQLHDHRCQSALRDCLAEGVSGDLHQ